jgi:hypothetical protein
MCVGNPLKWSKDYQDPEIDNQEDYDQFKSSVDCFHQFIYDDDWARFRHGLEIQYIMNLPARYPATRFIFLPNTALSRDLAKQHHTRGVLLDFAFEDISNLESNSPGVMPVRNDHRAAHLSQQNHVIMADHIKKLIENYDLHQDSIIELKLSEFELDKSKLSEYNKQHQL